MDKAINRNWREEKERNLKYKYVLLLPNISFKIVARLADGL
jgi:hypothetical protein